MTLKLHKVLAARAPSVILLLALALIFLVGALDYLTGYKLSFSIFYLVPVALAAWYGGRGVGLAICGASATTWLAVDYTGPVVGLPILFWNAAVRLGFFIITAWLLIELRHALARQTTLARTDSLTEVYSRGAFEQRCQLLFQLAARHRHPFCIGYLDIDNFKEVNDAFGHAQGDEVLRKVADILRNRFRTSDLIGRMGGDEFAIILPETDRTGAEKLFNDILFQLDRLSAQNEWPIGFSIGVAAFSPPPPDLDTAIDFADQLMYTAKTSSTTRFVVENYVADRERGFEATAEAAAMAD